LSLIFNKKSDLFIKETNSRPKLILNNNTCLGLGCFPLIKRFSPWFFNSLFCTKSKIQPLAGGAELKERIKITPG
jgi:hypothetical protein